MAQRALVLEETFVYRAFEDRRAQPLIQRGAQHGGQILGGETTIAIDHADPQVHVVLLAMVEMQANQEVRSDLAFLPQHLDIRCDEGEALFVQRPGQARIGLDVLPWLGEDRRQMQGKVLAVHAQLAMAKVAADAAGHIARGWRAKVSVKTDPLKVGGKTDFLIGAVLWADVHEHIAQQAGGFEVLDGLGETFRQRCQGIEQWRDGGQVEPVGLKFPYFLIFLGRQALLQLQA